MSQILKKKHQNGHHKLKKKKENYSILTSTQSSSGNSTNINSLGAGDGGISTIGLTGIDPFPPPIRITGGIDNSGR